MVFHSAWQSSHTREKCSKLIICYLMTQFTDFKWTLAKVVRDSLAIRGLSDSLRVLALLQARARVKRSKSVLNAGYAH